MRRYYTVGEVAEALGVSRTWIHVMIWRRRLRPSIRLGNMYGFSAAAMRALKMAAEEGMRVSEIKLTDLPPSDYQQAASLQQSG